MRSTAIAATLFATGLLWLGYGYAELAEAQTSRMRLDAEAQYTAGGPEQCLGCHGGEKMAIMAATPHGNLENPHSPYAQQGCESCHGPGSVHVSRSGGGAGRPVLLSFEDSGSIPEQNVACMSCHAGTLGELEGFAWKGSLHDEAEMSCQDCHNSHSTERPMWDKDLQQANCAGCHRRQIEGHPRFENAAIKYEELSCSTCHAVHELEAKIE